MGGDSAGGIDGRRAWGKPPGHGQLRVQCGVFAPAILLEMTPAPPNDHSAAASGNHAAAADAHAPPPTPAPEAIAAVRAEGSIEAEKMQIYRAYEPGRAVAYARRLAGLDEQV